MLDSLSVLQMNSISNHNKTDGPICCFGQGTVNPGETRCKHTIHHAAHLKQTYMTSQVIAGQRAERQTERNAHEGLNWWLLAGVNGQLPEVVQGPQPKDEFRLSRNRRKRSSSWTKSKGL